ncbi:hypothetical protein M23134_00540 [Microscilla marina ATCC 23134]|uniref:Uncharacterized protein n=1 Tax=Microscilla marina ATCC 23134 TaxID=313606 RepID=A1ZJC0_MICM2|nr:hypothetical protein M23134_00540 [Microscilla marina ATCC 23134]
MRACQPPSAQGTFDNMGKSTALCCTYLLHYNQVVFIILSSIVCSCVMQT